MRVNKTETKSETDIQGNKHLQVSFTFCFPGNQEENQTFFHGGGRPISGGRNL